MIGKLHPAIEYVFNTPSHHRVHHGRNPIYIDRNHGGTLIIWDRMFEPFRKNRKRVVYGITTPLQTWNPLRAQLDIWKDMAITIGRAKGIRHKLGILFQAPGWMPEELGGPILPKAVDPLTNKKFDVRILHPWHAYVLVSFLLILGGASFFVFAGGIEYPAAVAGSCHGIMVHHSYGIDTGETAPRIPGRRHASVATPVVIWWCSGQMLAAGITTGIMLLSLLCWPVLFRDSRSN